MKNEGLKHVIHLTQVFTVVFGFLLLSLGPLFAGNGLDFNSGNEEIDGILPLNKGRTTALFRKEHQNPEIMDVLVSGTVTDVTGKPIPGATVSVPGTSIG